MENRTAERIIPARRALKSYSIRYPKHQRSVEYNIFHILFLILLF
jgi:hypothetical protein